MSSVETARLAAKAQSCTPPSRSSTKPRPAPLPRALTASGAKSLLVSKPSSHTVTYRELRVDAAKANLGLYPQYDWHNQLTLAELQGIAPEFADDFYAAITLEATLDCHDVSGGTNRARVREALASARARLSSN